MPEPTSAAANNAAQAVDPFDPASAVDELRDIHGYHGLEIPEWIFWTLGILAAIALGYFIYWKFIRKDKVHVLNSLEKAIKDLDRLDVNQESKAFYLKYSEIVKRYLTDELDIPAMDKTIEELKPLLKKAKLIRTDQAIWITDSFQRAELAKFAKKELTASEKANDSKVMAMTLQDIDAEKQHQEKLLEELKEEELEQEELEA